MERSVKSEMQTEHDSVEDQWVDKLDLLAQSTSIRLKRAANAPPRPSVGYIRSLKQPNYDLCISQGNEATYEQNCNHLRQLFLTSLCF